VVANFPHNPTGALPALAEMQSIIAHCAARGAYYFCDEM
jgi:aspartate/methionine/tyrosine aminotransferase